MSDCSPEATAASAETVVFDFDGTLFDGDLGFEWLRWLLLRSPWRLLVLLAIAPLWAPLFLRRRGVQYGVAICFWCATLGQAQVSPKGFLGLRGAALRRRLFPAGLKALAEHRAAGATVVIATGEFPPLVIGLLAELPGGCPRVLGSRLEPGRLGARLRHHLQGGRKVSALRDAGFGDRYGLVYTDSATDAALIRRAERAVLVNFSGRRRSRLERVLGATARAQLHSVRWSL